MSQSQTQDLIVLRFRLLKPIIEKYGLKRDELSELYVLGEEVRGADSRFASVFGEETRRNIYWKQRVLGYSPDSEGSELSDTPEVGMFIFLDLKRTRKPRRPYLLGAIDSITPYFGSE